LQAEVFIRVLLSGGDHIIDGKKAPENSMQYMASVQDYNGHHVCGGFLITEEFVVSAAHCDDSLTHVVLGNHNLKNGNHQKIKIENKIIHENYQHVGLGNDIMLIKLSEKVQLGHGVRIIPLPPAEINLKENQVCQVAGWGKTKTDGKLVDELMVVNVSVITSKNCGYETTKGFCQVCFLSFQFKMGDSGGPLVCHGFAVGVVSFNYYNNCNYPSKPNVYTDISKYPIIILSSLVLTEKSRPKQQHLNFHIS
uniref:Granzyme B(G,H)-like n=1 Tax=Pundamilia nyererei TaxID=303518 RepID=A0A3B4EYZ1_9CICH